jgi:hypothetical protein
LNIKNESNKVAAQIDLLIQRADNAINLCEIKFSNAEYKLSATEYQKIKNKIFFLKEKIEKRKMVFPTMITTFGCSKNQYYLEIISNQVLLDDLFKTINTVRE